MKTYQTIHLRRFDVLVKDERTGVTNEDTIVFTKQQLQAAQLVGQSSKELIHRAYGREGYTVLDIGKARKLEVSLDLDGLFCEGESD